MQFNMDGNKLTFFGWLSDAEESDLFDHNDRSFVYPNLACESIMEQHPLTSDYDYVEKPIPEYSSNETMHIQNMTPESTNGTPAYTYSQDVLPTNLFYNTSDINHPYQTVNQNNAEFNPMYYGNPPKDVESISQFSVPSSVMDSPSIVPSTMNYIDSNTTPVVDYNSVSSLTNTMEHVPSNSMSEYAVIREMQRSCVNVESDAPPEQLHIASALLDVPLEHLGHNSVTVQPELTTESIDFGRVSQDVSMISDTNINFANEPIDSSSNIPSEFERSTNTCEYDDGSSRNMIIDENSQLSINYEVEDQTLHENVDISNCAYSEGESLSSTCVTNEITIAESQTSNTNESTSIVEERSTSNNNDERERSVKTESDEANCEVTNQVNGTIYEAEEGISLVQMCIRNGCANPAVNNPEWEQEFCSNDCVVIHCRNVFDAWVESNAVMSQ